MQHQQAQGKTYTTLPDLLPTSTTKPVIETATSAQLDDLLSYVPPSIFRLAIDPYSDADAPDAKIEDLTLNQKKIIVNWVLKSPQFHQGLGSLTMAIRDGGLPSIGDALGIKLQHGGLVRGGSVPLGGGEAVEAFVEGIRKTVEEKK
jgi:26S proteasome regulatory subunit N13